MPIFNHYPNWCDQCGWNLKPHTPDVAEGRFARLYTRIGAKSSRSLFKKTLKSTTLQPRWTASKLLAYFVATIVHSLTIGFAVLGIWLLLAHWPNIFAIMGGGLCLAVAWVTRPRLNSYPNDECIVARAAAPGLYAFVDRVAAELGARPLDSIILAEDFNASFSRYGWRQRRIMHLGLPLWTILTPAEQVALVGHELAHSVNGDANRGFFVGSAVHALATWYGLLRPDYVWNPRDGLQGLVAVPLNLILLALSGCAWLGAYCLIHLLWRNRQRAEYLADYLAATVSSTAAIHSLLDKLHLEASCKLAMQRVALGSGQKNMFSTLQEHIASIPAREWERLRRVERLEGSRLDATHPPTAYRIDFLNARPVAEPKIVLAAAEISQIEREVAAHQSRLQTLIAQRFTRRP
jgi:heat shock protein HtpX